MGVSKRTRFEIFKRDGFRCVYCGATPNTTVLHVDHVEPKAKGGTDDPANLVTACQPCNGGKLDVRLSEKRLQPGMAVEDAREHAEQLIGYLEAQRQVVAAKDEIVESLRERWEDLTENGTTASERGVLRSFSEQYSFADLVGAMEIAAAKFAHSYGTKDQRSLKSFKYFCGIVRRWRETGVVTMHLPRREVR